MYDLGFPSYEVTKATLSNTTYLIQILQAGTMDNMRDHRKPRLWVLRPCQTDDIVFRHLFCVSVLN